MKIRLLKTAPVAPEHGMTAGRELEPFARWRTHGYNGVKVTGDVGVVVSLYRDEFEVLEGHIGELPDTED